MIYIMLKTKYIDNFIIFSLMFMMLNSAISIAGSSIGMGFAFLGWCLKLIIKKINAEKIEFVSSPFGLAFSLFIIAIILSFVDSGYFHKNIKGLEDYLILFILFYMVLNNVKNLKTVKKLYHIGVISIIISSFYAIFYQHFYLNMGRIDSTFMALDFAALLLIYLTYSLNYFLIYDNFSKKQIFYGLLILLLGFTLLYNKSRGAWLGFVASATISLWFYKKKLIPILIIILIIVIILSPATIQNRIKSMTDLHNNRSNLGRIALWKGAVLMFSDNPFNGVGLNNFNESYNDGYRQPNTAADSHAHNNYLNILAETGLIGFFAFAYLVFVILKYLYNNYKSISGKFSKGFILSIFSSFIGVFIIQGFTEYNFSKSVVGRSMWFLLALTLVIIKIKKEETNE